MDQEFYPWSPIAADPRNDLPSKLSSVQVRYLTSATSSGRTQCTRLSTRGRAEAAGARWRNVERHFVGSKRVFNLANPAEMTRNRNFSPPDPVAGADRRRARDCD